MNAIHRPLAVVTGASSGIGLELAKLAAQDGHDLVVAADEAAIETAAATFRSLGATVDAIEVDLATPQGCEQLIATIGGRQVDVLMPLRDRTGT